MKKVLIVITGLFFTAAFSYAQDNDEDELVLINEGTFLMGSPAGEPKRASQELQRQITLSAFFIGRHEVTQAEYREIMGVNPALTKGENLPVEQVNWFKAVEYCNKLSEKEGLNPVYTINGQNLTWDKSANGYRLPTEAEWEYACRAGTTTPFSTGNNITSEQANFNGTIPYNNTAKSNYRRRTVKVESFTANSFGLFDMHGNVAEWCWDWHGEYARGAQTNPSGAASGGFKIFRGGGWNHPADFLRSAHRAALTPADKGYYLGFRVARNAE